jgi:hypothetical protein
MTDCHRFEADDGLCDLITLPTKFRQQFADVHVSG